MRTPRENVKMVLPAAPAAAVSAPLPVEGLKKPATSTLVLPEGPRPTVIISPQSSAAGPSAQSSGSRESPSAGTSMSMDARDSKLEEEMRKVKAAQAAAKATAAPAEPLKKKQGDVSDPEEIESGTFQEYKSTIPTPSNSPVMMGLSKALGSSKQQPQPNSDSVSSSVPATPQSPPPSSSSAAANSVSPASTPKRSTFPSSPNKVVSPGTAVITPPSASAPALTPTEESGIVGMAANSLVSSAKGMLGAIWSLGGEGVKQ
ncbi:hypothetical protein M407DRAFT_206814 [Tulasnella calospora MUT 4182]|uniref:Uncharacterized protein n=1 Tax=Tulasnella calospora MUT 4182 TaxID=1051891 RepID=A0A0C3QHA1_9AGAM|nr:hypothetical protein M407DRAFT_206814 [Tulasnella calospora MUT 4182]